MPETKENQIGGSKLNVFRSGSTIIENVLVEKHAQGVDREPQHQRSFGF